MAKTKTKPDENKKMTREEFLKSLTLQDIVDVLLVNYPSQMIEPILLQLQANNDMLALLDKHELIDEAFPENAEEGEGNAEEVDGEQATAAEGQEQEGQEVEQTGDAVEGEDDSSDAIAIEGEEQGQQEGGQQEDGEGAEQEGQEQEGQEQQQEEAGALELTADDPVSAAEAEAAAAQEVEEAPAAKKGRGRAKAAAPAKKVAKAEKPAAKKAGKAAKKEAAAEVATASVDLAKLVSKAELTKAGKAMGDAKPKKVLKDLGFTWPKNVKAEPESVALATSVVAAHVKLSAMPLAKLTALAEKHGVEVKFGNVRKDDKRVNMLVVAIIASALGEM